MRCYNHLRKTPYLGRHHFKVLTPVIAESDCFDSCSIACFLLFASSASMFISDIDQLFFNGIVVMVSNVRIFNHHHIFAATVAKSIQFVSDKRSNV